MGKGKALRRRAKLAEGANWGNLHKAAKGKASAQLPLPAAPGKQDLQERMPASLRKMMALRDLAAAQGGKTKGQQQQQQASTQGPPGSSTTPNGQQQQQPGAGAGAPATSQKQKQQQQQQQQAAGVVSGNPFTAAVGLTKTKQKRKEFFKAKRQKVKDKKAGVKQEQLQQEMSQDVPRFGEVVDAPLRVHLKRKHWDPAAAAAAEAARCKAVMLSQLERAEQQQQQRQQQKQQQQQQKSQKRQQVSKHKAAAAAAGGLKQAGEAAALREEVIAAYRAQRTQHTEGAATLGTLKKLVKT